MCLYRFPLIGLEYLTGLLISSQSGTDLLRLNPFLNMSTGVEQRIIDTLTIFCLRVNRVGHINRCLAMAEELILMLKGLVSLHGKSGREGQNERRIFYMALMYKTSDLAKALALRRQIVGGRALFGGQYDYDPRFLVFEYLFNILIRGQQVRLLNTFVNASRHGESKVQQMIMGAGKTTVIAPLLALILADGESLVTQVAHSHLLTLCIHKSYCRMLRVRTASDCCEIKRLTDHVELILLRLICSRPRSALSLLTGSFVYITLTSNKMLWL
jgi:hypothetical protein